MSFKFFLKINYFIWPLYFFLFLGLGRAGERQVIITLPESGAEVTNPFKLCMGVKGLILEPADNGTREGFGHHHILFSSLPADLSKPLKRKEAIHLSKAQTCVKLKMEPGNHVIIALFSYGNHVPYNPPIMDKVLIKVKN